MKSSLFIALITAIGPSLGQQCNETHPEPHGTYTPNQDWPHKRPSTPLEPNTKPVIPKVLSARIIGLADDPKLNRDSCGSVPFGDRVLWTCRDTQLFYANGSVQVLPVVTSTASWTDYAKDGGPVLQPRPYGADPLHFIALKQYGQNSVDKAFFPVTDAFCGDPTGGCADKTRYALWPDLPPMVAQSSSYGITAYTWIRESHIRQDLSEVETNPATTLYKVNYSPKSYGSRDALPQVTIVNQQFWKKGEISFGNYGNVVRNGIAYLYGQAGGITALAKVPANQVENKSAYQYWVNGAWTAKMPKLGQGGINITNANAQGQGTYYYSEPWKSYVWIGSTPTPVSDMYITTAPNPTGPWTKPFKFFTGVNGDYFLGAYSVQAHPGLISDPQKNEIYVTYTKNDLNRDKVNVYTSPLVYIQWQ